MKYGPEITAEIAKSLQMGNNRTDSCTLAGIHYETFLRWMDEHSEFCESIKKAEAECKARNITIIQKAAITSWQAAAWWLERKHRNEFALMKEEIQKDDEVPARMAKRAHELLAKLEGKKPAPSGSNGNGVHP